MSVRICSVMFIALGAACFGRPVLAQTENQRLQAVAAESAKRYAKAFADRDAKAIAGLFTPEAEYIDATGTIFHGRPAIEAEYSATFAVEPPGTIEIELISLRPVAAGLLVEDGITTFRPKDGKVQSRSRYTATHVKQSDGTWLLASVRELDAAQITPHDRLQQLSWLLGRWHEELDGNVVTTEWKWSDNGNFLISEFTVRKSRDATWSGTHRVGWDAERRQFRSWIFESSGGASEGWWKLNDAGAWTIRLDGVDAAGVRSSSTLTYELDGARGLVISRGESVRDGVNVPGSTHRVVRQPPSPGGATTPGSR